MTPRDIPTKLEAQLKLREKMFQVFKKNIEFLRKNKVLRIFRT
jgi:hypothetical protein